MAKKRALNISQNIREEILKLYNKEGLTVAQIFNRYKDKLTYWQVYNTINKRSPISLSVNESGSLENNKEQDELTLPDVDLSHFDSIENYLEHSLTVIIQQLNAKKMNPEKRVHLMKTITEVSKRLKLQMLEKHIKGNDAKLIIRIMRRLKPDITDGEIMEIYKEEAEKLKNS